MHSALKEPDDNRKAKQQNQRMILVLGVLFSGLAVGSYLLYRFTYEGITLGKTSSNPEILLLIPTIFFGGAFLWAHMMFRFSDQTEPPWW